MSSNVSGFKKHSLEAIFTESDDKQTLIAKVNAGFLRGKKITHLLDELKKGGKIEYKDNQWYIEDTLVNFSKPSSGVPLRLRRLSYRMKSLFSNTQADKRDAKTQLIVDAWLEGQKSASIPSIASSSSSSAASSSSSAASSSTDSSSEPIDSPSQSLTLEEKNELEIELVALEEKKASLSLQHEVLRGELAQLMDEGGAIDDTVSETAPKLLNIEKALDTLEKVCARIKGYAFGETFLEPKDIQDLTFVRDQFYKHDPEKLTTFEGRQDALKELRSQKAGFREVLESHRIAQLDIVAAIGIKRGEVTAKEEEAESAQEEIEAAQIQMNFLKMELSQFNVPTSHVLTSSSDESESSEQLESEPASLPPSVPVSAPPLSPKAVSQLAAMRWGHENGLTPDETQFYKNLSDVEKSLYQHMMYPLEIDHSVNFKPFANVFMGLIKGGCTEYKKLSPNVYELTMQCSKGAFSVRSKEIGLIVMNKIHITYHLEEKAWEIVNGVTIETPKIMLLGRVKFPLRGTIFKMSQDEENIVIDIKTMPKGTDWAVASLRTEGIEAEYLVNIAIAPDFIQWKK